MRTITVLLGMSFILLLLLSACGTVDFAATATALTVSQPPISTQAPSVVVAALTPTGAPSATLPPTATHTPTVTNTPSITPSPTTSLTPSITPSPTFDFPDVVVSVAQAHCRYGPSIAYLHAADLYEGDKGVVWGRFAYSAWLKVRFDKLDYPCWVAPSVVDVTGDISMIAYTEPNLLTIGSNMYGPPQNVAATRDGDQVTITWKRVAMTEDDDRGYFIEAWVCQNGAYLWWTVSFPDQYTTSYTVQDDTSGCAGESRGEIRTVEKHGYSEAVTIPWP